MHKAPLSVLLLMPVARSKGENCMVQLCFMKQRRRELWHGILQHVLCAGFKVANNGFEFDLGFLAPSFFWFLCTWICSRLDCQLKGAGNLLRQCISLKESNILMSWVDHHCIKGNSQEGTPWHTSVETVLDAHWNHPNFWYSYDSKSSSDCFWSVPWWDFGTVNGSRWDRSLVLMLCHKWGSHYIEHFPITGQSIYTPLLQIGESIGTWIHDFMFNLEKGKSCITMNDRKIIVLCEIGEASCLIVYQEFCHQPTHV